MAFDKTRRTYSYSLGGSLRHRFALENKIFSIFTGSLW